MAQWPNGLYTDTYPDSLEAAIAQAEWEFQVKPSEWGVQSAT